jgi:hypothetical protein
MRHADSASYLTSILRFCGTFFAGLAVLAFLAGSPASAATFTVTATADSGPGTLREAIANANSTAGPDTIEFQLAALPATITLLTGELSITDGLTITGPGAGELTIDANNSSRVFSVNSGATASLSGLTITGGNGAGIATGNGGGIYIASGATVTLSDSTDSGNTAFLGGGILNFGVLTVTGSTLSGNRSTLSGGGIQNNNALSLINSTVSGNIAANVGGGILNTNLAALSNNTVSGNSASVGGGVTNFGVALAMKNTIVASNLSGGNCAGGMISVGHNLSDDNTCAFLTASDLNNPAGGAGLDPAGLQDNGGPTQTIALLAGSPAIDAIPAPNDCTAVGGAPVIADQRGLPRPSPVGGNCDIGAFESQPAVIPPDDNEPPVITVVNGPLNGVPVGALATILAHFTDADANDTHTCTASWGDSLSDLGAMTEPTPAAEGLCQASHVFAQAGVYTIEVTVTDDGNASDTQSFQYVAVYDSRAGFLTGGGWFQSPAGALTEFPDVVGKANFGFSAKYQGRDTVPSGQTEFQFRAGNWNFHSSAYQWLVVTGDRAQFTGTGTVNGAGRYGFLLTATDGALNGGDDKLRLKVWDMDNGNAVVYDTQQGDPDSDAPATDLGGGSIVIHTR